MAMTQEKYARYDSADYLRDEADILLYLEAVMEGRGDDPACIAHALEVVGRAPGASPPTPAIRAAIRALVEGGGR